MHFPTAQKCLAAGKHFLNASYVSAEMQALDEAVKAKGLTFLCEMGLDPGIDHMSAMEIMDGIREKGGKIHRFHSHCGGFDCTGKRRQPLALQDQLEPPQYCTGG